MLNGPFTLRQLLEQHPEWGDLQLTLLNTVGELEYIGCNAFVYVGQDYSDPHMDVEDPRNVATDVLVFAPN